MSDESHKPGSAAVWHQWIEIAQLRLRWKPYAEGEAKSRSTEETGQTSTTRAAEPVMVANQVSLAELWDTPPPAIPISRNIPGPPCKSIEEDPRPLIKMGSEMLINQVRLHAEGIVAHSGNSKRWSHAEEMEQLDTLLRDIRQIRKIRERDAGVAPAPLVKKEAEPQSRLLEENQVMVNAESIVAHSGKSERWSHAEEMEQLDTLLRELRQIREIRERDTGVAPAPLPKMEVEPQHHQVKKSNQLKDNAEIIEDLYRCNWNIQLNGTTSGDTGASGNYGKSCGSEERVPDKMNPASMVRAVEPPAVCIQNLAQVNEVEPSFPCNVPCHLFDGTWFNARKEPIVIQRLTVTFGDGSVGTLVVGLFDKRLGVRLRLANDGYCCGYYDLEQEQFAWDGGRGIWSARINSTLVDITEPDQQLQMAYAMDGMSYTPEQFEKFYGEIWPTEWQRACEVTWQIRRCVVFLSEVGIPIDSLIFTEYKEDKENMSVAAKYERLAQSACIPLHRRALMLEKWNWPATQELNRAQGEQIWEEWRQHFEQFGDLTPEQQEKGSHYSRRVHSCMVRRTVGSVAWAKRLLNEGVYSRAALERHLLSVMAGTTAQPADEM